MQLLQNIFTYFFISSVSCKMNLNKMSSVAACWSNSSYLIKVVGVIVRPTSLPRSSTITSCSVSRIHFLLLKEQSFFFSVRRRKKRRSGGGRGNPPRICPEAYVLKPMLEKKCVFILKGCLAFRMAGELQYYDAG